MTSDQNLALYTKLSGFRLVVLANRFGCDTDVSRKLHERLLEGLEAAAGRIRTIMALERCVLAGDDDYAAYRLEGEIEIFGRFTINLLDELDIDFDTHEHRVNGGDWSIALTADYTGADIDYPELIAHRRRTRLTCADHQGCHAGNRYRGKCLPCQLHQVRSIIINPAAGSIMRRAARAVLR